MSLELYFDQALSMEQGDTLMIPCDDKRDQESIRVRLFQLRKKSHADNLSIYRAELGNKLFVAVRKNIPSTGMIVKKSGEIVSLNLPEPGYKSSLTRMAAAAIEDGLSLEEFIEATDGTFTREDATREYNLQLEASNEDNT